MKLLAICMGRPEKLPGKSYKTGINKTPVNAAVMVDGSGLVGDAVCNRKHHGGPDQAILVEGSSTIDWWSAELGRPFPYGSFGENLVVDGLDNRDIAVGDRFHVGEATFEATCPRSPCNTLAASLGDPLFARKFLAAGRPGIYCRVIREATVSPGDPVRVEPFSGDRVLLSELLASLGRELSDQDRSRYLAAPIGIRWRAKIRP